MEEDKGKMETKFFNNKLTCNDIFPLSYLLKTPTVCLTINSSISYFSVYSSSY